MTELADPSAPTPPSHPFYVVGVGASAGGLEALEGFFSAVEPTSGVAYVVVQHLSPDHPSLMPEILARRTPMRVVSAQDGMEVERDTVYLLPPKMQMVVAGGRLRLSEKVRPAAGPALPVDLFLRSLAEDLAERSIAVILSGTGSDGMRGVRAVKEAGGLVLAQDEATARFNGMPRSAIATGSVDYVLPPEAMPQVIAGYIAFVASSSERALPAPSVEESLGRIVRALKGRLGVDFGLYKMTSVRRRIERRMGINQLESLAEYATFVEDNQRELGTLAKEMLIGVTRFFRDQHVFDLLEKDVIPRLLQQTPADDAIRVWVPACATGEEAYSIAILFAEAAAELRRPVDVKIFATDLDRDAITFASAGVYAEGIAAELTPERLGRWFVRRGDEFHVARNLRQMVLFAHHNAFKDPPFTRLDLVSCRNLLIYMEPVLQRKLLNLFHYALKPERWLLLGTSETTGDLPDRFRVADARAKLYLSIPGPRTLVSDTQPRPVRSAGARSWQLEYRGQATDEAIAIEYVYKAVSAEFLPLCLLVNENNELVHVMGNAGGFLSIQPGVATLDVLSLLPKSLSTVLGAGLLRVAREGTEVVYAHLPAPSWEAPARRVTLRIRPIAQPRSDRRFTLLVVAEEPTGAAPEVADSGAERRVADLERELVLAKENLQATIEELQTANEELQATNEELISSNEELQSTNEELQAVNEELNTVNSEHEVKIGALVQLTDDMDNLLVSTGIGALFLDHELLIRKFTPAVKRQVNVLERDIGRPVEHLSFNFRDAELLPDLRRTLTTGETLERPVVTRDGESVLLRVLPYVARGGERAGVVLTFSEVTALKEAVAAHHAVLDALPDAVVVLAPTGLVERVNAAFLARWSGPPPAGRAYAELCGEALLLDAEQTARLAAGVGRVVSGKDESYEGVYESAAGRARVRAVASRRAPRSIVVTHTALDGGSLRAE